MWRGCVLMPAMRGRIPKKQVKQIAASIERFGFTNPVLVSDDGEIVAGHGRVEAAKLLGMKKVPTLALAHLSETERRAYVLRTAHRGRGTSLPVSGPIGEDRSEREKGPLSLPCGGGASQTA